MTFKPAIWYPIAVVLSALNLVGAGYALRPPEPLHAATHVVLALAFGLWARRLRQSSGGSENEARLEASENADRLDALDAEVIQLRQQLSEAHERLDFAERLLAQRPDPGRVGPQR